MPADDDYDPAYGDDEDRYAEWLFTEPELDYLEAYDADL